MPMFTKLNSMRSSVHFPFISTRRSSSSSSTFGTNQPSTLPYSHNSKSTATISQQQQQQQQLEQHPPLYSGLQRHRTISTPATNFAETLRVISTQMQQDQFDDIFNSFFYTDRRCENRAIFMAARLEQTMDFMHQDRQQHRQRRPCFFWELVMDRFYTLNYLLYVLPSNHRTKANYLSALDQHMNDTTIGRHLKSLCGGIETYFCLYYAMVKFGWTRTDDLSMMMEQAQKILEHCMNSESKLGHAERDAMYIFHGLRAGFHGCYSPKVVMDDDDDLLLVALQDAVRDNKNLTKQTCMNPFEDGACVVDEDEDD